MKIERHDGRVSGLNRIIALAAALSALALLAGCGIDMDAPVLGSSSDATQTPSPTSTMEPTTVATSTPLASMASSTPALTSRTTPGAVNESSPFQVMVK